jgi:Protein of unknown function (DUF2442)
MVRILAAEALEGFRLHLHLSDGTERVVDVSGFLRGPIFEPLRRDARLFAAVEVDPQLGTVVWPNGADIDPDVLILDRKPAALEVETPT